MRREKEILDSLNSVKSMSDEEFNEPLEGGGYNQGWIDALNFVLNEPNQYNIENLPDQVRDKLNKIEQDTYYDLGYKHMSGGYVNASVIDEDEITDPNDTVEDIEEYVVEIESGIDGENVKTTYIAYIRKDDYKIIYDVD